MTKSRNPDDQQTPQTGKVANDHNKVGNTEPTQRNEGKRTPDSRSDRESNIGGNNQNQSRRGTTGH